MSLVLFVTDRGDSHEHLIDALSAECDVLLAKIGENTDSKPDLVIVDDAALEDTLKTLKRMKDDQRSVFLPTVVLVGSGAASVGLSNAKPFIDAVMGRDEERAVLIDRIRYLLEVRELSKRVNRELSSIFDSMDSGICVVDAEHSIIRVNRPLAKILGTEPEEITGKMCENLFHTTTCREMECPVYRTLYGAMRSESEMMIRTKRNRQVPSLITSSALLNQDGNIVGAVVTVKDLSDRGREENERIEMQKYLSLAQKKEAIGKLSGSLAHYLNNLMAVILSNAYFSQKELDESHPVQSDLAAISEAAKRGVAVLDQLVSVSQKQILRPQLVDLNELILRSRDEIEKNFGADIKLSVDLSDKLYKIDIDLERLKKTILDLVSSSRDMMAGKGEIAIKTYCSYFVHRGRRDIEHRARNGAL
jgi:PAS domain S-box-containing protein